MAESDHTMFRPPAEAGSVLVRVADGCPHNACAFCAMYRGVPYREHPLDDIARDIALAALSRPDARRVFLADGDALALPDTRLAAILQLLHAAFPRLSRVNCYASGRALAARSGDQLAALRRAGLRTLYLGLESGADEVLRSMGKAGTVADMVDGCRLAREAGLDVSAMVLIGIGGQELSPLHVRETALALNAMQPDLLAFLRLVPVPGTPLWRRIADGRFRQLTEEEAVREARAILAGLDLRRTVFRADHGSNILPLAGRLPRDRDALLAELDELLRCGVLDRTGPGPMPALL
jgi:radical SAM superfamily enzyme YgiQ (UPF0313 family)